MNKYITINKVGKFYNVYGEDAIIIHYLFNYKVINRKVGFPSESLNKVKDKLNELNISYIINDNEKIEKDFGKLNKYEEYSLLANSKINTDKKIDLILKKIDKLLPKEIDELINYINIKIDKIYEAR